jgi:cytochrome o ubiquinol oxidase operon protein cyoD
MSTQPKVTAASHDAGAGTKFSYSVGFVLSIVLTAAAFLLVHIHVAHHHQSPSDSFIMAALPLLAVIQLFVQLIFFLHLSRESKPRWNALALSFAVTVVVILVIGSLWIMSNLNYRMMYSPTQINRYLKSQGDL